MMRLSRWVWIIALSAALIAPVALRSDAKTRVIFIGGHVAGGATNTSWANWDETTESGWGDANVFISLFENSVAGGNETGQGGGLSGANLVLTQSGSVAGASGSPPTRTLDGSNDSFAWTGTALNSFLTGGGQWTLVWKLNAVAAATDYLCELYDAGFLDQIFIQVASKMTFFMKQGSTTKLNAATADDYPTSGDLYVVMGYDGSTVYGGFSVTKPQSWAAIPAAQKVSAVATVSLSGLTSELNVLSAPGSSSWVACNAYYFLAAKSWLLGG